MNNRLSQFAVYTIRRSEDLDDIYSAKGGTGRFTERKKWAAALGLFEMSGDETAGKTHRSILRRFSERFVLSGKAAPEVGRAFTVAQSLRSTADHSAKGASAGDAVEAIAAMKVILEFAGPLLDPAADHKD